MTTGTMLDLRRTDLRSNVLTNPYWITSGEITNACDDQDAVLFSFPITGLVSPGYGNTKLIVMECCLEVVTLFAGGTIAFTIGKGSLATDDVTTSGVSTDVDVDEYWEATDGAADIIAAGYHFPTNGSNWVTDRIAGVGGEGYIITPADTTVPTVVAYLTSSAAITAGSAYFHMLIAEVPTIGR
jgi:hypothetical protein